MWVGRSPPRGMVGGAGAVSPSPENFRALLTRGTGFAESTRFGLKCHSVTSRATSDHRLGPLRADKQIVMRAVGAWVYLLVLDGDAAGSGGLARVVQGPGGAVGWARAGYWWWGFAAYSVVDDERFLEGGGPQCVEELGQLHPGDPQATGVVG
jgi:hypothetical protein